VNISHSDELEVAIEDDNRVSIECADCRCLHLLTSTETFGLVRRLCHAAFKVEERREHPQR